MSVFKIAFRDLVNSRGFTALFLFNLFLGICGFVTLHSFRDNVNSLLDDKVKAKTLSDAGYEFVKNNLTWDVVLPKFIKFYENLLN